MVVLKNQNGTGQFGTMKYLLDDEEDLKDLPLDVNIGSTATVIETGNVYLFSPKHSQWILQKKTNLSNQTELLDGSISRKKIDKEFEKNISSLENNITTLVGEDINKSVRTIANEELTKQLIPDNAQEALDTLQEIAEWIQNHPNDVATINKDIQQLKTAIGIVPEGLNIINYIDQNIETLKNDFDKKLAIYSTVIQYINKAIRISGNNYQEENKTLTITGRVL